MVTIQKLCIQFVARAKALGFKGKKRDELAVEFMLGAWSALDTVGHADTSHVGVVTTLLVVRGYAEVEHIAKQAQAE